VDLVFTKSASRHGVSNARAQYVITYHVWVFDVGGGMTLYVGPDRKGVDLEIGTVRGRTGGTYVIHAMRLRPQFVDEYRSRLPWKR